ncbi:MAG: FAD-binding oxidoreductase [Candidatus Aminicenantes bacterium]|nr:FAD-binding oxidoreductase [Candidatus Aminicenantes bacterium]
MDTKLSPAVLSELATIVGAGGLQTDPEKICDYGHDEFSLRDIARLPEAVLKPATTAEVSAILKLASREGIPVTPRGGATGLCGGCVPAPGGIVLSLERMNRVVEIDAANQMAVVEAGVTLLEFYKAVEDKGFAFPPHPGDESAMIGGLIATNAGGSRAVKYGVIRNYVRGLEVVLPRGDVVALGGKIVKNSSGYNLLQLMIGSEGTLGVITRATIQLLPGIKHMRSLVIPYETLEAAIDTVPVLLQKNLSPLAVEFVDRDVIRITEALLRKRWPCSSGTTDLLVILDAATEAELDRLSEEVAAVCLEKGAIDVFSADTPAKQNEVLQIRSKIYEAIKSETVEILDISLPRAEIPAHVKRVWEIGREFGLWLPTFGHAADGNVHTHIMKARPEGAAMIPVPESEWRPKFEAVRAAIYEDGRRRGGVVSGEHGIGLVKRDYLARSTDPVLIGLMRGLKAVFDPDGILNPGKIF